MDATLLYMASQTERRGTYSSMRTSKARSNVNTKTKTASDSLRILFRKKVAMIRGVNCALASCTASSRIENTKTMNVSMEDASAVRTMREPSTPTRACHPRRRSAHHMSRFVSSAARRPTSGGSQAEFRRKSRRR